MCGRFTQQRPSAELAELFGAENLAGEVEPRFNLAPTEPGLVVVQRDDQRRALVGYRWGLIPTWAENEKIGNRLFNARAETVATTPAFRASFARRRCIVPADAFYEWQKLTPKIRQPNLVRREDGEPMALAGLWSLWRDPADPDAPFLRTFTIVTTAANASLAAIHDRMPVILGPETWDRWLDPRTTDTAELARLLVPAPDELLVHYAVSRRVNDSDSDGPDLVVPLGPTGPEPGSSRASSGRRDDSTD